MISPVALARLQAEFARGMTTVALVERPVYVPDEVGDESLTFESLGTVKGWLAESPVQTTTQDLGQLDTAMTDRFEVPFGSDIQPRDRLTINGHTYKVVDTTEDETIPLTLSCTVRRAE